jgi:hypothetical protein
MKKSEMKKLVGLAYFSSVDEMTPRDICMSYLSKHEWRVITFGEGGDGNETLDLLNLNDFSRGKTSFAYRNSITSFVALRANLDPDSYEKYLAHELGHILLGHPLDALTPEHEQEANEFAVAFTALKPRFRFTRVISLVSALAFMLCTVGYFIGFGIGKAKSSSVYPALAPAASTSSEADVNKIVYYTASGDKYHNSGCPHIKDRPTLSITLGQAEVLGLEPCKSCLPDKD